MDQNKTFEAVCSNKPRPSVQGDKPNAMYKTGAVLWGRDLYHANGHSGKTLCGVNCDEWLKIGPIDAEKAKADFNFCKRCANKLDDLNVLNSTTK